MKISYRKTMAAWIGAMVGILWAGSFSAPKPALAGPHTDIEIKLSSQQLITEGGVYVTGSFAGRVFEGEMAPGSPNNDTIEPGFDVAAGTLTQGDQIRFDFVQQLLYWNGTALTTPPANLTVSLGSNSRTISGTDTAGLAGFIVGTTGATGGFHTDLTWSLPNTAADGLYGVVLTLGPAAGTTGFTASEPFLMGFVNGDPLTLNIEGGLEAMANVALAPVPEPSSMALAGLGVAGALAAGWRRRRRQAAAAKSAFAETAR